MPESMGANSRNGGNNESWSDSIRRQIHELREKIIRIREQETKKNEIFRSSTKGKPEDIERVVAASMAQTEEIISRHELTLRNLEDSLALKDLETQPELRTNKKAEIIERASIRIKEIKIEIQKALKAIDDLNEIRIAAQYEWQTRKLDNEIDLLNKRIDSLKNELDMYQNILISHNAQILGADDKEIHEALNDLPEFGDWEKEI